MFPAACTFRMCALVVELSVWFIVPLTVSEPPMITVKVPLCVSVPPPATTTSALPRLMLPPGVDVSIVTTTPLGMVSVPVKL